MGLYCEFDVVEDFGFIRATEMFNIYPDYSEGCQVFVETFNRVSTSLVPVDTGYLQSTLRADTDGDTSCYAETDCEYAQYVEYGTSYMSEQPYFEPAFEEALSAAAPLWEEAQAVAEAEEAELEEMMNQAQQARGAAAARATAARGASTNMMAARGAAASMAGNIGAVIGAVIGTMIVAAIVVTASVALNTSSNPANSRSGGSRGAGAGGGGVYMPPVEIT